MMIIEPRNSCLIRANGRGKASRLRHRIGREMRKLSNEYLDRKHRPNPILLMLPTSSMVTEAPASAAVETSAVMGATPSKYK